MGLSDNEDGAANAGGPLNPGTGPTGAKAPRGPLQPRTAAEIQQWFVAFLADALETPPENIDTAAPFEQFGLDSVTAVGMSGSLEDWLGCSIDPMVVYDYPTIEALSVHLAERTQAG